MADTQFLALPNAKTVLKFCRDLFFYNSNDHSTDSKALAKHGYKLGAKIGDGTFSIVLKSTYSNNGEPPVQLACKVMDPSKAHPYVAEKFLPRELEILKKLNHSNIIQVHSIAEHGPKVFVFMELAENGDLNQYIERKGPVKELRAKVWFLQMANALNYLHSRGIAHRDMKCENVLITKKFNVKLTDFGFSCYCRDKCGLDIMSESYCGSEAYVAPEVMRFCPYDSQMTDTWALGVILFMMLNAKFPFDVTNRVKLLIEKRNKDYSYPRHLEGFITDNAKATVAALLEPEPHARWSARDILNCTWLQTASD